MCERSAALLRSLNAASGGCARARWQEEGEEGMINQ